MLGIRKEGFIGHCGFFFFTIYSGVLLQVYALMKTFTVFVPSVPDGNTGFHAK